MLPYEPGMADAVERLDAMYVEAVAHCERVIGKPDANGKQRDLCRDVVGALEFRM